MSHLCINTHPNEWEVGEGVGERGWGRGEGGEGMGEDEVGVVRKKTTKWENS